jgi:thymidylate synthase
MNTLDKQYTDLLQDILDNGVTKQDRTGTGTLSVFGRQIRHKMSEGFPLLTTKKMYFKGIVTELLWFLRGDRDIRFLWENNCSIWDGDWYKKYKTTCSEPYTLDEVKQKVKEGNHNFHDSMFDMGPIYGAQWRSWGYEPQTDERGYGIKGIDQIANLINDLKTNPDSRRLMVTAWNPCELDSMVLPPCHYGFQVYTRELSHDERFEIYKNSNIGGRVLQNHITAINFKQFHFDEANIPTRAISLMYNARSQDVPLGTPFNIASYALLLEIIARMVNMVPDELITNMGDCHIYLNQIDGIKQQLTREPYPLPKLKIIGYPQEYLNPNDERLCDEFEVDDFVIENYQSHPTIKMPLSN